MLNRRVLIATLVAAGCAYAMLRHAKQMLFEGTTFAEGGGLTAAVLVEFMAALGAISVAVS